jgi:hypothetical protein
MSGWLGSTEVTEIIKKAKKQDQARTRADDASARVGIQQRHLGQVPSVSASAPVKILMCR